jgi:hypothetical protein
MSTLPLIDAAPAATGATDPALAAEGPMTAKDVAAALCRRWSPEEYVHIAEAPTSSDRLGRKLDVVVFSCWASRGHEIDGVEIKVSLSDLKRELANAAKADWWWQHVHRFWVAMPAALAAKVAAGAVDWPSGWGLLSCTPDAAPTVFRKPAKHEAESLPWSAVVGILRAATGCGRNALYGAEQAGYNRGVAAEKARSGRSEGDAFQSRQLRELTDKVAAFEKASGLRVAADYNGRRLGEDVALLRHLARDPASIASTIDRTAEDVRRQADQLAALAGVARKLGAGA